MMNELNTSGTVLPERGCIESTHTEPSNAALPEWKISGIFCSHMVLQRDRSIRVWGWSRHISAEVTGVWDGEQVVSHVAHDGSFSLTFSPRGASFTPTAMEISSAWGKSRFEDILVGDVWLIGGQSNADLPLAPCLKTTPEIEKTLSPDLPIRLFTQTQSYAASHTEFHTAPAADIINPDWHWQRPTPEASKAFSALGYYFGRILSEKVAVPLGLIMMCAGGACLRELMPASLAAELGYTTGANVPIAGYFNTLIAPLIGVQFRGQLFFQGESEGIWKEMALSYDTDLAAYVADERARFGIDFGFYNVQLSSYREEGAQFFPHLHWVRSRQYSAQYLIPKYYLAVSRDLGALPEDSDFAHSPHKWELARRLVTLVCAAEYGIGSLEEANSPMPESWSRDKATVTIRFRSCNGGLKTPSDAPLVGFAFPDAEGTEHPVRARITAPDTVTVELPVEFANAPLHYAMHPIAYLEQANLCGGTDLPAPAFILDEK